MTCAILILASGASSRMRGGDKLLEKVGGWPLVATLALSARTASPMVFVTVPTVNHPRADALEGLPATLVPVPDAQDGMSASIRRGVDALPEEAAAVMLLPADMPELTAQDLRDVITLWRQQPDTITQATGQDGTPGHPVIFPRRLFPALKALTGDQGARTILQAETPQRIALPARHALTDLDTPEDWASWRRANAHR
ncbi:nucleotidyltransferase family protein [Pseudooceanicola sp. C21-150M6]|uniref:nucleotidyltransferase family protein n=1 Tax=Pseudooceanicola sp. C21-150M6 TaxID=3434355 RepID=UPI003D7F31BF